jgi:prevent-host-death family protein
MKQFTKTQLTQNVGEVLTATYRDKVAITSRGKKSHVLMMIEDYEELIKEISDLRLELSSRDGVSPPSPD